MSREKSNRLFIRYAVVVSLIMFSCEADDPFQEDTPELITKAIFQFTSDAGEEIFVTASDPDGEGIQSLVVDGPVQLSNHTRYALTITLVNELAERASGAYDISEEVREEGSEHLFFFGWEGNIFAAPDGDGNLDARADIVNYIDVDELGLPLGLETSWTTGDASSGILRVVLKHQPDFKSTTSTVEDGETDLDIEMDVIVD